MNQPSPVNTALERSLIGVLLIEPREIRRVRNLIQPRDLDDPLLRGALMAIYALSDSRGDVSFLTVAQELRRLGMPEPDPGNDAFLCELMNEVNGLEPVETYAKQLRELAVARRAMMAFDRMQEVLSSRVGVTSGVLAEMQQVGISLAGELADAEVQHCKQGLREMILELQAAHERKEAISGVPTGLHGVDEMLGGYQATDMVLVGARPSMGKTSYGVKSAYAASSGANELQIKIPTLVFSLEMTKTQIYRRAVASEANVRLEKFQSGQLETVDWIRVTKICGEMAESPLYVVDDVCNLETIIAKTRRWRMDQQIFPHGLKDRALVVVDYIQRVKCPGATREREVAMVSDGLKTLAKELHIALVALAQLTRECEKRQDKRPMLSDLGEAGALEKDADVVIFLYRDEMYNRESEDKGIAEIIIGKHRNGPTGTVRASYRPEFTRFSELATDRFSPSR